MPDTFLGRKGRSMENFDTQSVTLYPKARHLHSVLLIALHPSRAWPIGDVPEARRVAAQTRCRPIS
jgi:hypothetical protein